PFVLDVLEPAGLLAREERAREPVRARFAGASAPEHHARDEVDVPVRLDLAVLDLDLAEAGGGRRHARERPGQHAPDPVRVAELLESPREDAGVVLRPVVL